MHNLYLLCDDMNSQQSSGSTLLALTHIHGRGGTLLELSGASCPSSSAATTSRASPSCRLLAGNSTSGSGWRDGWGAAAQFTRPHSMTFASHQSAVVLTDIDNRALRKVSLGDTSTGFPDVSSIVYAGRQQQVRRSLSDVSVKFKKLKGKISWEEANRRCAERGAHVGLVAPGWTRVAEPGACASLELTTGAVLAPLRTGIRLKLSRRAQHTASRLRCGD